MILMKDNETFQLSAETRKKLKEANAFAEENDERIKLLEPICPDGSGEIGKFDQQASTFLGGMPIYKTSSGRYFHWVDTVKKGKVIDPKHLNIK